MKEFIRTRTSAIIDFTKVISMYDILEYVKKNQISNKPINYKYPLDFKIYINGNPIVIEFNSPQHYSFTSYSNKNKRYLTIEEFSCLIWMGMRECVKWKSFNEIGTIVIVPWFLGGFGIDSFPTKLRYVLSKLKDHGIYLFKQEFDYMNLMFVPINLTSIIKRDDRIFENMIEKFEISRIINNSKFSDFNSGSHKSPIIYLYKSTTENVNLSDCYSLMFMILSRLYRSLINIDYMRVDWKYILMKPSRLKSNKLIISYPVGDIKLVEDDVVIKIIQIIEKYHSLEITI